MVNGLIYSILLIAVLFWLEGIFPHFKDRRNRIRHAFPNIVLACINSIILSLLFAGIILVVMHWSKNNFVGLVRIPSISLFAKGLISFILFDFWMYLWHRANHRIPLLWRFHRVHHNDLEMDTTTALRFHPLEIIFSSMLRLFIIPLIGMDIFVLLIYEMSLQLVVFFHHSNIALSERVDRVYRLLFVSPDMHRVHHSQERNETDSNYASVFSFWDRIFGTYREGDTQSIVYGLRSLMDEKWQTVKGLLLLPFK